jgi:CBS domain-containing protein
MGSGSTRELARSALGGVTVGEVITVRGRELQTSARVRDARAALSSASIQVLPVLDAGGRYRGAIPRAAVVEELDDDGLALPLAGDVLPVAPVDLAAEQALRLMDEAQATRLVVVGPDDVYVGLVCLRTDRLRLCVDAECHLVEPTAA